MDAYHGQQEKYLKYLNTMLPQKHEEPRVRTLGGLLQTIFPFIGWNHLIAAKNNEDKFNWGISNLMGETLAAAGWQLTTPLTVEGNQRKKLPQIKAGYLGGEVGWPVIVLFSIDSQDLLLLTSFRAEIVPPAGPVKTSNPPRVFYEF